MVRDGKAKTNQGNLREVLMKSYPLSLEFGFDTQVPNGTRIPEQSFTSFTYTLNMDLICPEDMIYVNGGKRTSDPSKWVVLDIKNPEIEERPKLIKACYRRF